MLGDNGQIQMVILNALNNAIYALKEQSGPKQIYLRLNKNVNEIQIECQDSGPGFPVDFIKKGPGLFQTSKKEGMGVGLWLSKTIIENHNGTLRIENHQKGGALLCIRLPIFNPLHNSHLNEN
jgi:C4-dicarboxylate-specific signal transduction histidine kinase